MRAVKTMSGWSERSRTTKMLFTDAWSGKRLENFKVVSTGATVFCCEFLILARELHKKRTCRLLLSALIIFLIYLFFSVLTCHVLKCFSYSIYSPLLTCHTLLIIQYTQKVFYLPAQLLNLPQWHVLLILAQPWLHVLAHCFKCVIFYSLNTGL